MTKKQIFLAATLFFLGTATAQNHVSNIRVNQRGDQLFVMYDLSEKADIEAYVSFDNGTTFRGPLRQVSGEIGKEVEKGNNKSFTWDIVKEVGNVHFTSTVIKVVAIPKTSPTTSEKKESEKKKLFYLSYGMGLPLTTELDAALFVNRHIGLGFSYLYKVYNNNYGDDYYIMFIGPSFHGMFGKNKWAFTTRTGMGLLRYTDYYWENNSEFLGILISTGVNYTITNINRLPKLGIGMNINLLFYDDNTFWEEPLGAIGTTLSLNLRF